MARSVMLDTLRRALEDGEPVWLGGSRRTCETEPPAGTAVVARTSGSTTGVGRPVALSAEALRYSARATHDRLAGPGQWLLALPTHHIAGVQVLVRSLEVGIHPMALPHGLFDPGALATSIDQMRTDVPRYVSLVPAQLHDVVAAGGGATRALATCAAVLIGGASLDPHLLSAAQEHGVRVVRTYGMTETCGGCVYDGQPLEGVQVRIEGGRVRIAGPVLASGYLDDGPAGFEIEDGARWLITGDAGELTSGGLRILGRLDDVLVTGGVNVHPAAVERVLPRWPGVWGWCVVGVPEARWGQLVTAVALGTPATGLALEVVREAVRSSLGPGAHLPRALVALPDPAVIGPGKPDRRLIAQQAAHALAQGRGERR